MSKTTGVIIAALVITVVAIAIGYAEISEQVLTISGELQAIGEQSNFALAFEGTPTIVNGDNATVTATANGNQAEFSVAGFKAVGEKASATYTIKNSSVNLKAINLAATVTEGNSKYFKTTLTPNPLTPTTLEPGESTTITVTTELVGAPIAESTTQNVVVTISADPEEVQ